MEERVELVTGLEVAPADNLYEFYTKLRIIPLRFTNTWGSFFLPLYKGGAD